MLRVRPLKRFLSTGMVRRLVCRNSTNTAAVLNNDTKPKKKISELTPQELEAELKENLIRLRKSFDRDESDNYVVPIFKKSLLYADQSAVKDSKGDYTYLQLYLSAKRLAIQISNICGSASMKNIGYICANNVLSPLTQWACWISGQVAMPLNISTSVDVLKNLLKESKAGALIVTKEYEQLACQLAEPLDVPMLVIDHSFMVSSETTLFSVPRVLLPTLGTVIVEGTFSNDFYTMANAMLLYTMGTSGKPKGVMITHRNLDAQVKSLTKAWKYDSNDCLMHALPLNHAHGFINAFMCPLHCGGRIVMHDKFDTKNVWSSLLGINTPVKERVNVFMAVPAVYNLLISEYEKALSRNGKIVDYISNYCKENVRLMISGGAPLPPTLFRRWREITGHNILECYGTTEFGLALSSPYNENDDSQAYFKRQAGYVGLPLPDVHVRLVNSKNKVLINCVGEFTDNRWTVKFFESNDTNDTSKNQVDHRTRSVEGKVGNAKNFLIRLAKLLTDNIVNTAEKAVNLLKVFQQSIEKAKEDFDNSTASIDKSTITKCNNIDESKPKEEQIKNIETDRQHQLPHKYDDIIDTRDPETLFGELQVTGPHIFTKYFDNSEATRNAFHEEFFRTGDLASFHNGVFKILGRTNVDIIEIGSRKISSYDIESLILEHPNVRDVSVIAIPNSKDASTKQESTQNEKTEESNHTLGIVCVLQQKAPLDLDSLNLFCARSLPKYLFPTQLKIVDELPRSNMIEINRKALRQLFQKSEDTSSGKDTERT